METNPTQCQPNVWYILNPNWKKYWDWFNAHYIWNGFNTCPPQHWIRLQK